MRLAERDDGRGDFMPGDAGKRDERISPTEGVEVAAAEANAADAQQGFSWFHLRFFDVFNASRSGLAHYQRLHQPSLRSICLCLRVRDTGPSI